MGFPRQQLDGTTSLAILVPGEGIDPKRPRERSVSLGQIVGRLQKGVGHLDGFSEDLRNIAKPVKPLNYGAFGSYAPSYDSTFATITKDETHLMFNTYNNEGTSYLSESVMNVAKDYDYTFTMADNLLDLLTGGEHTRTTKLAEEQQKLTEENKTTNKCEIPAQSSEAMPVKVELEQLKTLSELGIDTSFLTEFGIINY
ncbi:hypothetical protein AAG570_001322 [Ranatra chinensis]|uniref:Uncharacterized protein n=1 Tax=Ranatra chinensis TaxID=642074 RepID=A0ABD0YBI9_9HEMI